MAKGKRKDRLHIMYVIFIRSKIFSNKIILARRTGTFPQNKTSSIIPSLLVSSSMKTKHTHMQPATLIATFAMGIWNNPLSELTKLQENTYSTAFSYLVSFIILPLSTKSNRFSSVCYKCLKLHYCLQTGLRH